MPRLLALIALLTLPFFASGADMSHGADNFYSSPRVTVQKVTFKNQYQMQVAGNLFVPRIWTAACRTRPSWSVTRWVR